MEYQVLIIDDEWELRSTGYERLRDEITIRDSSFEIKLDFLKQPARSSLIAQLHRNQYAAVISDAVLDGKWEGFTIADVMEILDEDIPIAIVSKSWDRANAKQIARAWEKPNCRTFLHWRDIDGSEDGQIEYAIESVLRMITDHQHIDIKTRLKPDEDIRIVHISDVHTGGVSNKNLKLEAQECASAILAHWDEQSPTFVAFTGDVTEFGAPSQYEMAYEWIAHFIKHLNLGDLPSRNLLYVPGNHDVNLRLAAGSRIVLKKDRKDNLSLKLEEEVTQPELIDYAYVPFRNFLTKICDCPLIKNDIKDHNLAWVESRFRHLGVVFYGLNTAQPANATGLPGSEVDPDALAIIKEELGICIDSCNSVPLVIGMGHHSPVAAGKDGAVTNLDAFKTAFQGKSRTPMFLHGHIHESILTDEKINNARLFRSGAATFTKLSKDRNEDTLRGFNLLTLHRSKHEVKSLSASSFGWVNRGILPIQECYYELHEGMFREATKSTE